MTDNSALPYPVKCRAFQTSAILSGLKVGVLFAQTLGASVFTCGTDKLIQVYHAGHEPNQNLRTMLATRTSEHLCRILQTGKADGHEYDIVQKYQKRYVNWHSLTAAQRRKCIIEDLRSIDELHRWGYCHLDIRPEQFLHDDHGVVRLTGFFNASPVQGKRTGMRLSSTSRYSAPEVKGGGYSTASDVYSYGVILRDREQTLPAPTSESISTLTRRMLYASPERRPLISEAIAFLLQPQLRIRLLPVAGAQGENHNANTLGPSPGELRRMVLSELHQVALRAEPALAAQQFLRFSASCEHTEQLGTELQILRAIPKAATDTNATNINASNLNSALQTEIITNLPAAVRGDVYDPPSFLPAGSFYIFRRSDLEQWQKAQRDIQEKRKERTRRTIRAVLFSLAVIVALPIALAIAAIMLALGAF